ncbi:phosphoserine phosphatase SerB [Streptococcus himalayensis]|uniref:phosphoserine phosphatase n=1 Tax=Streptococcus himalayensis TaxID=1888195 RepID=A0A917EEL9_9STRE|nr:phosphoserine phosphatase SerB [Streptococcus himalayensis]GGE29302.1 phosphoserine phosphatase SerB [Streptococcus himalayensis]
MTAVTGLLVMDVDSTLIQEEVIDLLGEAAGVGEQVARITERAMRGELEFKEALYARVALLKGLPQSIFEEVLDKVHVTKGAHELIDRLKHEGYKIGVVSGGFHETVDSIASQLGIDYVMANRLEIKDGFLTGQVLGEIITKETKKECLLHWARENQLAISQTVAVGDGANDLPMIQTAGIGIAFNAKPVVRKAAPYQINEYDLYQVWHLIQSVKRK